MIQEMRPVIHVFQFRQLVSNKSDHNFLFLFPQGQNPAKGVLHQNGLSAKLSTQPQEEFIKCLIINTMVNLSSVHIRYPAA